MPVIERGGLIVRDYAGGRIGTIANMTAASAWGQGLDGPHISYATASDDLITFPHDSKLDLADGTGITLAARLAPTLGTGLAAFFTKPFAATHTDPFYDWSMLVRNSGEINIRIGSTSQISTLTIPAAVETNVVITADGVEWKWYINGLQQEEFFSATLPTNTNSQPIRLGTNADGNEDYSGKLNYAYAWNRALNANEILELHRDPYAMFRFRRRQVKAQVVVAAEMEGSYFHESIRTDFQPMRVVSY
jgi:hypothetical protein